MNSPTSVEPRLIKYGCIRLLHYHNNNNNNSRSRYLYSTGPVGTSPTSGSLVPCSISMLGAKQLLLFRSWFQMLGFWQSTAPHAIIPAPNQIPISHNSTTPHILFWCDWRNTVLYGGTVQHCNALDRLRMQITNMFQARKIAGKGVTLTLPCPMISSRRDTDCSV